MRGRPAELLAQSVDDLEKIEDAVNVSQVSGWDVAGALIILGLAWPVSHLAGRIVRRIARRVPTMPDYVPDLVDRATQALVIFIGLPAGAGLMLVRGPLATVLYEGGTFLADFGSEGDNPGSQLFYVPTGTSDPIVTGDPGFLADLNAYIDAEECLSDHRGAIVPRNECESDWVNIFSLRIQQEIKAWGDSSFDLFFDIENLGNFLYEGWGRIDTYTAPSNVAPATAAIEGNQYVYTPNASYQGPGDPIVPAQAIARIPSVYRVQLGLRFRF